MIRHIALAFLIFLWSAVAALAGGDYNAHFGDMDANGDNSVVKEEFAAYFKDDSGEAFDIIDADKSGGIDHDEWHAFKEAHGYGHMDGKGHMEGMGLKDGGAHMKTIKP